MGQGNGDFVVQGLGVVRRKPVKVVTFAPFFVSQQLRCSLCPAKLSPALGACVVAVSVTAIHRREVLDIQYGLAPTTALLSSKMPQLLSLLLPF